ncbi:coronin [Puccinia sorghi]|uniref:Coronin n=1 Tax=Puccinia sorghi TaxID=27349 RepID=A0A0L6VJR1_9BASI|nr:coronin [Puccinia sorghi]
MSYGQPSKREMCFDNIKVSASAWDTNLASANSKFLSVNYQASGGGAYLVVPLSHTGKLPDLYPLCRAHTAPVLDTSFSPFSENLIASSGEDGKVVLTNVDEDRLSAALRIEKPEVNDLEPVQRLSGHVRKAGHVKWHPVAENVLASASLEVRIWDVEKATCAVELPQQPDMVGSMSFNWTGTLLATTCKDKKLRIYDLRSGEVTSIVDSHTGIKGSRVEWMGRLDRICTTGFSKFSDRQVFVWNSGDMAKGPIKQLTIDTSSGTLMPFWSDNDILFLAGKGDGNVRYYEYEADELTEYKSNEPQRGMCWLPRRALNTPDCEIARAYKVTNNLVEPISFIVPRKTAEPILVSLDNLSETAAPPIKQSLYASTPAASASAAISPSLPTSDPPAPRSFSRAPSPVSSRHEPLPGSTPAIEPPVSRQPSLSSSVTPSGDTHNVNQLSKENQELREELAEKDCHAQSLKAFK